MLLTYLNAFSSSGDTIERVTDTASPAHQILADPVRVLAEYRRGDFLFATAERTILASGVARELHGADLAVLDEALTGELADSAMPIAAGVLPFDARPSVPARLILPRELRVTGPAHQPISKLPARPVGLPARLLAVPEQARHVDAVRRALAAMTSGTPGDLRKVVLARALDVTFDDDVDPGSVLHNLIAGNPDGFTFAAGLPGQRRTLLGSSPELLVRRSGSSVVAHPHAGTAPRSADPVIDEKNAKALLASAKDQTEHALVIEAVVEALRPFCRTLHVPPEPSLTSTPAVWHLGTEITGELRDPDVTAFRLACALHPTPAVCGTPTAAARRLATELEPFDRDYYAGALGWVDAAGDGEWAVAIRCAEVDGNAMRLYAGGGIVPASDPQAELEETTAKFATLLRAMGIDLDPSR